MVLSRAVEPVIYRPPGGMPVINVLKMVFLRTFPYSRTFQALIYRPSVQSGLIPYHFRSILAILQLLEPSCLSALCLLPEDSIDSVGSVLQGFQPGFVCLLPAYWIDFLHEIVRVFCIFQNSLNLVYYHYYPIHL